MFGEHEIQYFAMIESGKAIQPGASAGMRLPVPTAAMGRAMIAHEFPTFFAFRKRFEMALIPRATSAQRDSRECRYWNCDELERGFSVVSRENVEGHLAQDCAVPSGRLRERRAACGRQGRYRPQRAFDQERPGNRDGSAATISRIKNPIVN